MLLSTVPFAALRKAGKTVLVFWIRGGSTVVYLVISVAFLVVWHEHDCDIPGVRGGRDDHRRRLPRAPR